MVSTFEEVSYGNAQTTGGVVTCQHGPTECEGNMIEACATEIGGSNLGVEFTTCMFAAIPWASAATAGRKCAVAVGISWAPVDKCFGKGTGAQGVKLIAANAARTAALQPPHTYVPWLVVGGTPIPDPPSGGPAPADFLTAICKAYTGTPPACCSAPEIAALRHRTEHLSKKDW
jgi:interferon gamma-inducible protein 30